MQLPQSFDHKFSTVFFIFFLNPCACLEIFVAYCGAPLGPGHNCHCAASLSLLQSQNAQEHRLSLSSFVFDWIKLPCLVRVLVALPSLCLPLSLSHFSVSCSHVAMLCVACWPMYAFIHSFSCPDSCLLSSSSPLERVRIQSLAQCLNQSYWSSLERETERRRERGRARVECSKLKPHTLIN